MTTYPIPYLNTGILMGERSYDVDHARHLICVDVRAVLDAHPICNRLQKFPSPNLVRGIQ